MDVITAHMTILKHLQCPSLKLTADLTGDPLVVVKHQRLSGQPLTHLWLILSYFCPAKLQTNVSYLAAD